MITQLGAAQETWTGSAAALTSEQQAILGRMRNFAEQYVSNLPNFICEQTTYQFEAGRNGKHWHKGDTLTSRLTYNQGREDRTVEFINDKPRKSPFRYWHAPLTTEGEFGILLATIFSPSSNAQFTWRGWETVRDRRLAVFDFSIDQDHSTLRLSLSDLAHAVVPYHGSLYGDPATGNIWRISDGTSEIPPEVRTKSIATVIDYDLFDIGGKSYLLPAHAVVTLATDHNQERNELEFRNYRKFEAESTITFTSDEPLPQAPHP